MDRIDLHIHSNYSDGKFSPKEIIDMAYESKYRLIQDVKDGKNINLENYIETNDNVPSNKISRIGTYLSDKITIIAKNSIKLIGKIFETIFGE